MLPRGFRLALFLPKSGDLALLPRDWTRAGIGRFLVEDRGLLAGAGSSSGPEESLHLANLARLWRRCTDSGAVLGAGQP